MNEELPSMRSVSQPRKSASDRRNPIWDGLITVVAVAAVLVWYFADLVWGVKLALSIAIVVAVFAGEAFLPHSFTRK